MNSPSLSPILVPIRWSLALALLLAALPVAAQSTSRADEPVLAPAPTLSWSDYEDLQRERSTETREFARRSTQSSPSRSAALTINAQSRSAVRNAYYNYYLPPFSVPMNWTGSTATCTPGTTSAAYRNATIDLINFYRAMVGLPGVINHTSDNPGAQAAALIMSAQNALNHNPPATWNCHTSAGAASAASSNLALGAAGPAAIRLYFLEAGAHNVDVGHRRWILYPPRAAMGTGSVGPRDANALDVFGPTTVRPATPAAIAWPPEGYVPYQLTYPRWSFSLNAAPWANYASATVTMTELDVAGDGDIPVTIISRNTSHGDRAIVWEPINLVFHTGMEDRTFEITISNILNSPISEYTYEVTVMNPAIILENVFADGFETGNLQPWN